MARRYTLKDIAATAGVSASTVSRSIAGDHRVSAEIQGRVREAALKLGIDLSEKAKSRIVAFILSNRGVLHSFHSRVLVGAEAYCAEKGFDILIILSFHYNPYTPPNDLHLPQALLGRRLARGAILSGVNSPNLLALFRKKRIPFAVLGNNVIGEWEPWNCDVVYADDILGAHDVTRSLQLAGHRDIWYVGNHQLPWFARCAEGYRKAMEEAGFVPRLSGIRSEDAQKVGYLSTKLILNQGNPVSAIFAGTDETAAGVYKALLEFGRRIPEDVNVVGMGDVDAVKLNPRLTSVREFPEQLGEHLAEMVINRIVHPDLAPRQVTIPTEVVKRESFSSFSVHA